MEKEAKIALDAAQAAGAQAPADSRRHFKKPRKLLLRRGSKCPKGKDGAIAARSAKRRASEAKSKGAWLATRSNEKAKTAYELEQQRLEQERIELQKVEKEVAENARSEKHIELLSLVVAAQNVMLAWSRKWLSQN